MSDDRHPPSEYRWARQVSAVLLIAVVVVIVVLDVIVEGYEVSPPVLVPLLLTAAGLLSVDLPQGAPLMAAYGTDPAKYLPPHTSQLATKLSADGVDDCLVCSHPRPRQRRQPRRGDPDTTGS